MQKTMPDIANTAAALQTGKLDWVGMGDIELPFIFESLDLAPVTVNAKARAFVSLAMARRIASLRQARLCPTSHGKKSNKT